MPMVAAAIVTLYMVRILKPPLGNALRTTSHECRAGVISELLRGVVKIKAPWPLGAGQLDLVRFAQFACARHVGDTRPDPLSVGL